jgi:hypothetical protein
MKPVSLPWMMKTNFVFVAALALCACAKDTQISDHAIQQQCRMELEASRTAIQLRDEGKTRQAMLQTLPMLTPTSTRLLQQMYHIVDEVYAFPDLNQIVYGTYRYEYCARELRHQPVPLHFQKIYPRLQACQQQFNMTVSKPAVDCVRAAFPTQPAATPGVVPGTAPENSWHELEDFATIDL